MLPNEPANVLAVRACLTAEAWRIGHITKRQLFALEHFFTVHIRHRYFGRRNEKQFWVGDAKGVLFKLRELSRSGHRATIYQERRQYLLILMLLRVQIQHEIDQRTFQPRSRAFGKRET